MTGTRFLGLGGGWQSSALFLMSCAGVLPKLDGAIFADTQGEMDETYEYLDYLQGHSDAAGIPLIRVTAGNLEADVYAKAGKGMQPSLPVRVMGVDPKTDEPKLQRVNSYTCSYDYKRRIVTREIRRLCGPRGAWKRAPHIEHWMGFSRDEAWRMKPEAECRCGHSRVLSVSKRSGRQMGHHADKTCAQCRCVRFDAWRTMRFPLVMDLQMSRRDCQRWIVDAGHPAPPRSACFFCPNRGNEHWRDLRDHHPDKWQRAVQLDKFVRHGLNKLDGEAFIHQSGVPLDEADLRPRGQVLADDFGVLPLFDGEDSDCDAEVCFT